MTVYPFRFENFGEFLSKDKAKTLSVNMSLLATGLWLITRIGANIVHFEGKSKKMREKV